jgi:hypothetical protein
LATILSEGPCELETGDAEPLARRDVVRAPSFTGTTRIWLRTTFPRGVAPNPRRNMDSGTTSAPLYRDGSCFLEFTIGSIVGGTARMGDRHARTSARPIAAPPRDGLSSVNVFVIEL